MLNNRKLILDTFSEVYNELKPWADDEFYSFGYHDPIPNSVYVIGREQVTRNLSYVKELAQDPEFVLVFDNSAEGSDTLESQLLMYELMGLVNRRQLLLISGGDMRPEIPHLMHEHFLCRITDYSENLAAMSQISSIFAKTEKPYQFLFLNGRMRPHRKYLWHKLDNVNLLDNALWTMLDNRGIYQHHFILRDSNNSDIIASTIKSRKLPKHYEVERYRDIAFEHNSLVPKFIKSAMFSKEWGEIYLQAEPYIDTYFSLVTETIFESPHSFRTEKIAKPLAMGHPWICASNQGFYRDMHSIGFKTFGHLIDERFDNIPGHQNRMDYIVSVVKDLCEQNLSEFLLAAQDVCKYNQQHLLEIAPLIRKDFPDRFFSFITEMRP